MSECDLRYEPLPEWSQEEMEQVIRRGEPQQVALVPLTASLNPPDFDWTQSICVRLSLHSDKVVRGNAILGLGYLAMSCKRLDERITRPIIEAGMQENDEWVRGRSEDAAEMCTTYLKWTFADST